MKTHISKLILFFVVAYSHLNSQNQPVFNEQAFGQGSSSYYIGSGAFKRHLDLNKLGYKIQEYSKSPALVIGADFCIYPHASNAYLGLGPYFTSWIGVREINNNNQIIQKTFSNTTLAVKFTHHASLFVRKKLDICSGYILGVNFKYYHDYKINGIDTDVSEMNKEIVPALGITISAKYYAFKNVGFYLEGGIGYRINMLNVGFCYKFKRRQEN
jgi:hypothetical protein